MNYIKIIIQELRQNKRTIYYFVFAISSVIIFSCLPDFHPDKYINDRYNTRGDLWIHAGAYFMMGMLGLLLLYQSQRLVTLNLLLLAAFSVLMEFVQLIVPERGFSFLDILSNIAGIALAGLITYFFYKFRNRKSHSPD